MKDVSLRGVEGVANEMIVNKIQDFAWDEVLSQFILLPKVLVNILVLCMYTKEPFKMGSCKLRHLLTLPSPICHTLLLKTLIYCYFTW